MQPSVTADCADMNLKPPPSFSNLNGVSLLQSHPAQMPATQKTDIPHGLSSLKRSQYNRHIGEMLQSEIECRSETQALETLDQLRVFEEMWLAISETENANQLGFT